jgi:hypothetical protein
VDPACRRQLLHPLALYLSLPREPGSPVTSRCPRASPFLSLRRGPVLSDPPSSRSSWTSACALSHVAGFSTTTPAHVPRPLFRAPPVPRTHPSPHFAQLHPLSRYAHTASRRRRPALVFLAIQLAEDCSRPPRAPPRGETPVPVPNFLYCALCSFNFAFAGTRPRRSTMLARWLADLARSSSPMLVPKVHPPLLKPA